MGPLFEHVDLSLSPGEVVALVGRNGVGKTSLLRILGGLESPTTGRVVLDRGAKVAYLPQDFDHGFSGTLAERFDVPLYALARCASRVGLDVELLHAPYAQLSLGEKMRGTIAGLLASEPTLLLLDEPTNHLDIEAKAWLVEFLRTCRESVLLVCHDRAVLEEVPDRILELTSNGLTSYTGSYSAMQEEKLSREARLRREYEDHRAETRRLKNVAEVVKQRAIKTGKKPPGNDYSASAKPYYDAKKARVEKQAKAVLKRVQRELSAAPDKPFEPDALTVEFPTLPLRSAQPLVVRGLTKSFGDRTLLEGLDLTLEHRSRLALVGPNGTGKTTLLRLLTGELEADAGEIVWSSDARIAILSQARNAVDASLPAAHAAGGEPQLARTVLACLGMRGELGSRIVGNLSVGERTKVEIASMILHGANVLILDEPTNHLDIPSLEALETALTRFKGVVIFVSHDREFVSRLATEVLELG